MDKAMYMLKRMQQEGTDLDVVTYDTILDRLCKTGRLREVQYLFNQMVSQGISPDNITYNTSASSFWQLGKCKEASKFLYEWWITEFILML